MQELYHLDPSYSVIYHDENSVEFRRGVWNVTSHYFNDDTKTGSLSKVVLGIEEKGTSDIQLLAKHTEVHFKECDQIVNLLREKNILVNAFDEDKPLDQPMLQLNSPIIGSRKISLINDSEISSLLLSLLRNRFPNLEIVLYSRKELSFLEEHHENLFRDALLLEKTLEVAKTLFGNSLVVSISESMDPIFHLFLNKVLYEAKVPWFFSSIDGPFVYVGPLFTRNFCFECLEQRILMNTKNSGDYLRYKKALILQKVRQAKPVVDESIKMLACSLACLELTHYLNTGRCIAKHKLLSIFMPTMEFSYHKMLRLPGCRVCGVDNAQNGHQIHFDMGAMIQQ